MQLWVDVVYMALVPNYPTLALVKGTPLPSFARPAGDISIAFGCAELHEVGFSSVPATFAREDSGYIFGSAIKLLLRVALSMLAVITRGVDPFPSHRMVVGDSGFTDSDPPIGRIFPFNVRGPVLDDMFDSVRDTARFLREGAFDDGVILLNGGLAVGGNSRIVACNTSVSKPAYLLPFFLR